MPKTQNNIISAWRCRSISDSVTDGTNEASLKPIVCTGKLMLKHFPYYPQNILSLFCQRYTNVDFKISSYLPVKLVLLLKSRLIFNIFYCFCMFVGIGIFLHEILRNKNAKFPGYYFCMNTTIYGDFQICISVPLNNSALIKSSKVSLQGLFPKTFIRPVIR